MASTSNEVINTRERPLSSDINDLQSLIGRDFLDTLRWLLSQPAFPAVGVSETEVSQNMILGGLAVVPDGNNVAVSPGALVQYSSTLAPTPGSLDSDYRLGVNRSATTVTMASPGATTWYLVEAQMVEITTVSASRDVLDTGTGTFIPTLVPKQMERQLDFQVLTGTTTNAPTPTGGDWVPLAIVRRPGGGGAVAVTDIYDVRKLAADLLKYQSSMLYEDRTLLASRYSTSGITGVASENIIVRNFAARAIDAGLEMHLTANYVSAFSIVSATYLEPGTVFAANRWYYLYMCPWNGLPVRNGQSLLGNALLVISASEPQPNLYPPALSPINLPAPFANGGTQGEGHAVCVAALRRNSLNTGWVGQWCEDSKTHYVVYLGGITLDTLNPPTNGDNSIALTSGTPSVPTHAREIEVLVTWDGAAGAPTALAVSTQIPGTGVSLDTQYINDGNGSVFETILLKYPLQVGGATTMDLNVGGAPDAGSVATVSLRSWTV